MRNEVIDALASVSNKADDLFKHRNTLLTRNGELEDEVMLLSSRIREVRDKVVEQSKTIANLQCVKPEPQGLYIYANGALRFGEKVMPRGRTFFRAEMKGITHDLREMDRTPTTDFYKSEWYVMGCTPRGLMVYAEV